MSVSDRVVSGWLESFRTTPTWLGLFTAVPASVSDVLTIEAQGASYRRPAASWRLAGPRLLVQDTPVTWLGLTAFTTVYAVGVFDSPYNGHLLADFLLPVPRSFPAGGNYGPLAPGDLYLAL